MLSGWLVKAAVPGGFLAAALGIATKIDTQVRPEGYDEAARSVRASASPEIPRGMTMIDGKPMLALD